MKHQVAIIFISILSVLACQSPPTKSVNVNGGVQHGFLPPPVWNASMQNLKQHMVNLEPYIFDKAQFNDPKNNEYLKKEIHNLAVESKNVKHDPLVLTKDPTIVFVAAQFSDELQKADINFSTGWSEYSRWQLAKVTSYCLECHTRMREGPSFSYDESSKSYVKNLPAAERVELMIAFRQYEPAYSYVLEKLNEAQSGVNLNYDPDRIARLGLLVSVQYMQDVGKAKRITVAIEKNSTLPIYLKQSNRLWKKSLALWEPNENLNVLPKIRNLLKKRISEIEDMRAIPALLRLLTEGLSREELGEALLLTGESYEALHKISAMSLHESYYESCVRKSPKTKWAPICFKKLSDSITLGYTGSSGTHIPSEVKLHLEEIEKVFKN